MFELEEAVGLDEPPKHENLKNIPYLTAVIDEGYAY